jgi:hypothetical protein
MLIHDLINEQADTDGLEVRYSFSLDISGLPDFSDMVSDESLPALVKSFAIPSTKAILSIDEMTTVTFSKSGEYLYASDDIDYQKIYIIKDFRFRDAKGYSVFIDLMTRSDDYEISEHYHLITHVAFTLQGIGAIESPTEISEAFASSYRALFANFDTSYLMGLQYKKPSLMILSHTSIATHPRILDFINWKKAIGFDVSVIYKTTGANLSAEQLRQMVIAEYNSLDNKPDYLLLVGGSREGNSYQIPPFMVQVPPSLQGGGTFDATDFQYGVVEDTDFFPEMIVGRFSVSSINDINAIFPKTRFYEQGNFTNTNNWLSRATVIAANYGPGGVQPTTPILMSRWIAETLRSHGFQTTELYHGTEHGNGAVTTHIQNALTQGSQFITYRGWGSSQGWIYPQLFIPNLSQTNNAGRLPVVYSVVCATGDFHHPVNNPSFGEFWMTMGSANQHNGAVAFVGPTYLYTSTDYNNCIGSGMITGVFNEGIRIFGSSVMRGRIELYNHYPRELEVVIPFYWKTYNILSDPSLNLWVHAPQTVSVTIPQTVRPHENAIAINAEDINIGWATATRNGTDFTVARVVNGTAILPLPHTDSGASYIVTISARNHRPAMQEVTISGDTGIGLIHHEMESGSFTAGNTARINLEIKNFSTVTIDDVTTVLTSASPFVSEITPVDAQVQSILAGYQAILTFDVSLHDDTPDDLDIPMNLYISPSQHNAKFSMIAGGYRFEIVAVTPLTTTGVISPGDTNATLQLTIENPGNITADDITGSVRPLTDALSIPQPNFVISDLSPGTQTQVTITLDIETDCFVGRNAIFHVQYHKDDIKVGDSYFSLVIGAVDTTSVTGPDRYGYYAYDINTARYTDMVPVYDWVEINPDRGGHGTIIAFQDDTTHTIDLPFSFKYYGIVYDKISINDNGWIAFGELPFFYNDFRNWKLPSTLGPRALVAVFWDDLKGKIIPGTNPLQHQDMEIKYWHDVAQNRFVVTWDDVYFSRDEFQNAGHIEFQVILEPRGDDDGDIIFQYKQILNFSETTNFSSIGIQNHLRNDGICYSYSNFYPASATPLRNGLAIRFTTRAPDPFIAIDEESIPQKQIVLHQNYPNPFNPNTSIAFDLRHDAHVALTIYNLKGQKVREIINERMTSGSHSVIFDGHSDNHETLASGIYFYMLQIDNTERLVKKMVLIK